MTLPLQQLHNAIIYGKVPTLFVNFGTFSVEFSLHHTERFSFSLEENIAILDKCAAIRDINGKVDIKTLPMPLFELLLTMYVDFQQRTIPQLSVCMDDYIDDAESRAQWLLAKAMGVTSTLTTIDGQLNTFQRTWVVRNALQDKIEQADTITNVIEVLKPWLDRELYTHVQERKANTRENVMFDDDDDAMDAEIRANAARTAARIPRDDVGDTIRIKE